MFELSNDGSTRWKIGHFLKRPVALAIPVAILLVLLGNWWISRPFKTLQRFADFVEAKQFDNAILLIASEDRKKIPAAYWEQLRHAELQVLTSPTPLTLIDGRMALFISARSSDSEFWSGSGIRFVIDGNDVLVHEVTFRESR